MNSLSICQLCESRTRRVCHNLKCPFKVDEFPGFCKSHSKDYVLCNTCSEATIYTEALPKTPKAKAVKRKREGTPTESFLMTDMFKPEQSDNEEDEVEEIEETEEEIREKEFLVDQDIMAKIAGFRNNGYTGKPITCTVCTKKDIMTFLDLRMHLWNEHKHKSKYDDDDWMKCTSCATEVPNILSLREHLMKVHNDSRFPKKQFHCKSCSFSAEKKDDLISHIVQNHPRKIVCQPCNIILSDRDHQNSHTAWAHEEQSDSYNNSKTGKFACDFCHAKFPSKNSYNSHIEHIHPTQIKRYICDECNIAFYNRNFLKFHIGEIHQARSTDTQRSLFSCDTCPSKFREVEYLELHTDAYHPFKVI